MTSEFEAQVIQEFAHEMWCRIGEATVVAQAAEDFSKKGLTDRAVKSFLQIKPLLHEASALMRASLIVHRRDHERLDY